MAFGIPNSDSGSGGKFLGRIQFDTRVGFWQVIKRIQHADGTYGDQKSPFLQSASLLIDFGTLEVGYLKLSSPPSFLVVPYGRAIPPQPEEMETDAQGKQKKAFQPGFRVQVYSQKTFGDTDAYYFSNSSKTVLGPMDELHQRYLASPEAAQGLVPVVSVTSCTPVVVTTPKGKNTFQAPNFEIVQWVPRPEVLGERTVPVPLVGAHQMPAAPVHHAPPPSASTMTHSQVASHVPPPTKKAAALASDEIPF